MAEFAKGMWTALFDEVIGAVAVSAWSPTAQATARPYLARD